MSAGIGALYIFEDELKLVSSFAFNKRANLSNRYSLGEGTVGQVGLERSPILLTHLKANERLIVTGTTEVLPINTYTFPLMAEDQLIAVIELAGLEEFTELQIGFLRQSSEQLAVSIRSVQQKVRTEELLRTSQRMQQELEVRQLELKSSNEELEAQTVALKESEDQLRKQQDELQGSNAVLEAQKLKLQESTREVEIKAEQIERQSRYKSEFLANMSHELRTPLNSLLILSEILMGNKESNLTAKQVGYSSSIHDAGNQLLMLIDDILDMSKVEAGVLELQLERYPIDIIPDFINANFRHQVDKKGIYLKVSMDRDVGEFIVTDDRRLMQIMKNLISNAVKFTEKGGITVSVRPVNKSSRNMIAIAVADTGIGIPDDKRDIVFQAFQQVDGSVSRKYGGTGLGLSISQKLAELLGGEVTLDTEIGKGSTFTLTIPVDSELGAGTITNQLDDEHQKSVNFVRSAATKVNVDKSDRSVGLSASEVVASDIKATEKNAPNVKIFKDELMGMTELSCESKTRRGGSLLIVEDDIDFALVLADAAHSCGFDAVIAGNGEEAILLAKELLPAAITLDIRLPDMDGWEVLKALRLDTDLRYTPVHIMSVLEKPNEIQGGFSTYTQKPVTEKEIYEVFDCIDTSTIDAPKLLIIDDVDKSRKILKDIIENSDCSVTVDIAETGAIGLNKIKSGEYSCLVLNLDMADIPGEELLSTIQHDGFMQSLRILTYSDRVIGEDELRNLHLYTDDVIDSSSSSQGRLLEDVDQFLVKVENKLNEASVSLEEESLLDESLLIGKKILVVDDDAKNLLSMSALLEQYQVLVITASNGQEGLDIVRETEDIDIILMDIMMPVMDGYEAIRRLRKLDKRKDIPVIAVTAKAMKEDKELFLKAGATDYITKPLKVRELISLLLIWLNASKLRKESKDVALN